MKITEHPLKMLWSSACLLATCCLLPAPVHALAEPSPGSDSQQVKPGEVPEGLTAAAWDSVQDQIRLSAYKARPNLW